MKSDLLGINILSKNAHLRKVKLKGFHKANTIDILLQLKPLKA